MKKTTRILFIDIIIFIIFTVIMFAAPLTKNIDFALAYFFSSIAILSQVYFMKVAFEKGKGAKSKFYGFPIARISVIYLIVQLVCALVFTITSTIFENSSIVWIEIIIYAILIGFVLIGTVTADSIRNEINRQDTSLKQSVQVMREIQSKMSQIIALSSENNMSEIKNLVEEIKYSDPVTSQGNELIEYQLKEIIDDLQKVLIDGKTSEVSGLCKKAQEVLSERNRLCKLNK